MRKLGFNEGLNPVSKYEKFSQLREGVVFCWLSPEDQKIYNDNDIIALSYEVVIDVHGQEWTQDMLDDIVTRITQRTIGEVTVSFM